VKNLISKGYFTHFNKDKRITSNKIHVLARTLYTLQPVLTLHAYEAEGHVTHSLAETERSNMSHVVLSDS
jgi:hypothetical protein